MPLPTSSDTFLSDVLAPLKNSYLCEESKQSFRYTSAVLIKNAELEKKVSLSGFPHFYVMSLKYLLISFPFYQYNAFRVKKRELGYTDKDLKESYGFLLFSDINKVRT